LYDIVRALKSFSARQITKLHKTPGLPVWQRNYYEHIIRNEEGHQQIYQYIHANPAGWAADGENPGKQP